MFMQVIHGKVRDVDLLNSQVEKWDAELKPGAKGYLGRTSGITADGDSIAFVRFESEADGEANGNRPEQGAWWEATSKAFDGEPEFMNCTEVDEMFGGGSNDAGFVQIMIGRSNDPAKMRAGGQEMEGELRAMRPDILGGVVGWYGDNQFVQAIYFTSEEAARKGESTMSDDPSVDEWSKLIDGPMTFIDLTEPDFD